MDCCYASDMLRTVSKQSRVFEMLAASQIGQTTPGPGQNSFTLRLTKHLKELAGNSTETPFTTRDLVEKLQSDSSNPAPALWRRMTGSTRHIRLCRLKLLDERLKRKADDTHYGPSLRLEFAFKSGSIREEHIDRLTKGLPKLFANADLPLVNIKWLGYR